MQGADPASLAIGTQVSAKYKGAYCEAKVKSVDKTIKVRVTLKGPHGANGPSITIKDKDIISINNEILQNGAVIKVKHPDSGEIGEATVKQIQDQSRYTVIFNDGDIATLKRNALCMKSGKHFNASESLDNLPLTHPEHFSSPANQRDSRGGGRRRHKSGPNDEEGDQSDEDSSSSEEGGDDILVNDPYQSNIGRVVWAENTDKKTKAKDSWFLALIVAPSASDTAKIRTKKEFLIRSFKDGRYYTVSKKDTKRFRHNESPIKKSDHTPALNEAMERAINFLETRELPPHWDRDILNNHEEESTNNSTTASSESEELEEDDDEEESPEEKDHLVAELYKHMEDRGSPIDRTPSIEGKDVDLYKLYRIVDKLGGNVRVSNKSLWRTVANKLGFFSTWGINQVRVNYKRYLQSFEELNRTLGCTMVNHPRTSSTTAMGSGLRNRQISGSSRVQMRGTSRAKASVEEKVIVTTAPSTPENPSQPELEPEPAATETEPEASPVKEEAPVEKTPKQPPKEEPQQESPQSGKRSAKKPTKAELARKKAQEEQKMTTRPRRDSTSSLAAAMQVKAQKDSIGASSKASESKKPVVRMDRNKETEFEAKKLVNSPPKVAGSNPEKPISSSVSTTSTSSKSSNPDDSSSDEKKIGGRRPIIKKEPPNSGKRPKEEPISNIKDDDQDVQHLSDEIEVSVGDKIRVFYKFDNIYEAKVKRVQTKENAKWPRYFVHYQGWNARYDEWIKRSKIKENLSWSNKEGKSKNSGDQNVDSDKEAESEPVPEKKKPGPKKKEKVADKEMTPTASASTASAKKDSSRAGTPSSVKGSSSRTGSPALKRQSSRTSVKKDTDSDEEDSEPNSRKSSRLTKNQPPIEVEKVEKNRGRGGRKRVLKEESETEEIEVEKTDSEIPKQPQIEAVEATEISPTKAKRGRKAAVKNVIEDSGSEVESNKTEPRSSRSTPTREKAASEKPKATPTLTPTRGKSAASRSSGRSSGRLNNPSEEEQEDPYAFKEPENVETPAKADKRKKADEQPSEQPQKTASKMAKSESSDSTDSSSSEAEIKKRTQRSTRKIETEAKIEAEAVQDDAEIKAEEPPASIPDKIMQFTKKQQEIFPNLASKMAPKVENVESEVKSEAENSEVVEAEITKKQRKTPSKPKSDELIDSESESDEDQKSSEAIEAKKLPATSKKAKKESVLDAEDEPLIKSNSRRSEAKAASPLATSKKAKIEAKTTSEKAKEEEDLDLACGETIPGSPIHPSSSPSAAPASTASIPGPAGDLNQPQKSSSSSSSVKSANGSASTRLEMPFASVPESVSGPQNEAIAAASLTLPATLPPATSETPETTASTPSRASPAPQNLPEPKSPGDSSEVDMESLKAESVDIEGSSSGEAKQQQRGLKRKQPLSEAGSRSPAASRRKRRTRESGGRGGRGGGRGRHSSGMRHGGQNDDTDESEEAKNEALGEIGSLDNDALAALAQQSPRSSKYNFYPDFDTNMDSNTRISIIQTNIKNLKKAYQSIKSKLATTERQIKKIRRKEREKSEDSSATKSSTAIEASA